MTLKNLKIASTAAAARAGIKIDASASLEQIAAAIGRPAPTLRQCCANLEAWLAQQAATNYDAQRQAAIWLADIEARIRAMALNRRMQRACDLLEEIEPAMACRDDQDAKQMRLLCKLREKALSMARGERLDAAALG